MTGTFVLNFTPLKRTLLLVMIRYEADHKEWRQEPVTFMRWFINVPAKVVHSARKVFVKMSVHYWQIGRAHV